MSKSTKRLIMLVLFIICYLGFGALVWYSKNKEYITIFIED